MRFTVENKQSIKRCIAAVSRFIGGSTGNTSVILNYHSIHPTHLASTRPDDFESQMEYVKANFTVVSLSEFVAMRVTNEWTGNKLAMITFDDGYLDNYEYAYPVLRRLGLPATIFITTAFVNGEMDITRNFPEYCGLKPLNWSQVKEMRENKICFGTHTHTHPILTRISPCEAEAEILLSKQILENQLKEPVRHFAYTLGQPATFNKTIIDLLEKHDFELACSTIWGTDNRLTDIFSLHRIRVDDCDSMDDFIAKINGSWNFIRYFQEIKGVSRS